MEVLLPSARISWLARAAGLALACSVASSAALAEGAPGAPVEGAPGVPAEAAPGAPAEGAPGALARTLPWDQGAVTAVAAKVQRALRDLDQKVAQNPRVPQTAPQRRAWRQARESLQLLELTSQRLASQLRAGKDRDATLATFRRLEMSRRNAERAGRKAEIPGPTLDRIVSAQGLIDQLVPYYGPMEDEAADPDEAGA